MHSTDFPDRVSFTLHNTLGARDTPNFRQRRESLNQQQDSERYPGSTRSIFSEPDLPLRHGVSDLPKSTTKDLSELGDSSPLFSFNSPALFDFGSAIKPTDNNCPIPFVFWHLKGSDIERRAGSSKQNGQRKITCQSSQGTSELSHGQRTAPEADRELLSLQGSSIECTSIWPAHTPAIASQSSSSQGVIKCVHPTQVST
jgi:hypothetical protein